MRCWRSGRPVIRGVGLDIMQVGRMERSLLDRPALLERVFTDEEREYLATRASLARSAAGLFAAKEAVVKALGVGIGHLSFRDVAFTHSERGQPLLLLETEGMVHVSITHMGDTAAAVAVWETET